MVVRTVSQLPREDAFQLDGASLLEVSKLDSKDDGIDKYTSVGVTLSGVQDMIAGQLSSQMVARYAMDDTSQNPIQISSLEQRVERIESADLSVSGIKTFTSFPVISAVFPQNESQLEPYGGSDLSIVPTVGFVREEVEKSPVFESSDKSMVADGCPFTDMLGMPIRTGDQICYDWTIGLNDDKFYCWKIDENGTDSSKTVWDGTSRTTDSYEYMRDTGNLVVWGWLADNGNVAPYAAWVGLFGQIKAPGNDNNYMDVPLQIRPWVRGSSAQVLQYVGFNIPVRKGLRLKIKTGFPVKGGGGGMQEAGTLTFKDKWIPNAFFGYIIKNA